MRSVGAMIHYCALPDKSIGKLACSKVYVPVVAPFDS
jgi:hypothetical protein